MFSWFKGLEHNKEESNAKLALTLVENAIKCRFGLWNFENIEVLFSLISRPREIEDDNTKVFSWFKGLQHDKEVI